MFYNFKKEFFDFLPGLYFGGSVDSLDAFGCCRLAGIAVRTNKHWERRAIPATKFDTLRYALFFWLASWINQRN